MIESFLLIFLGFLIWIVWMASKKKRPESLKDLESELKDEYHDKEKDYIQKMNDIRRAAEEELHEKELEHRESIKGIRKDSVNRSRFSLTGKIWEQVVSLIPGFKHNPADMRFLGSPVDYIVFKGMSKKAIEKVIFLEIKTGDSQLTEQQEKLKRAVKAGRVSWQEYRVK